MNLEDKARLLCQNPSKLFKNVTDLHSRPRHEQDELQLKAVQQRFEQLRDAVPMLKKLADNQDIAEVNDIEDVVPLLFDHTMYKSYPANLLYEGKFDKLTQWLNKLTRHDISGFDVSGCNGVDDWLIKLNKETPLYVHHTSGTSGTFSFMPKSKEDWDRFWINYPLGYFNEFGDDGTPEKFPLNIHAIYPNFRSGLVGQVTVNDFVVELICGGDESLFHSAYPGRLSSDVMLLSARIRAANAKGELDRLEINPELLAKRDEFLQSQQNQDHVIQFMKDTCNELKGKRVFMQAPSNMLYEIARDGLAKNEKNNFAPDSIVVCGGGGKGIILPDNWHEVIEEFLGINRVIRLYGMSELLTSMPICSHEKYHVPPMTIPYILDPDTSEPLAREGTVTGRWAHYDLLTDGYWGGFISGDEVTMHWDSNCPCGRKTPYVDNNIQRYSEKNKGDDKITCAATQDAYDEAMDFLVNIKV